jgi:hypothetical protein
MPSESSRVTTASESRFRIDYPNSAPRAVKVIALDYESRVLVDEVAKLDWTRAAFFTSLSFSGTAPAPPRAGESASMEAWLRDIAGQTKNLIEEIDTADLVVMVASAGSDAQAALLIGEACAVRKVTTIGLIVQGPATTDEETSRTLKHMRPVATMLVIATGEEYIEGMLTALRA